MDAIRHLAYCGRCGASRTGVPPVGGVAPVSGLRPVGGVADAGGDWPIDAPPNPGGPFRCSACGFTLFFNAAAAAGAVIRRTDGRAMFVRRANDPAKGKLGLPGGFVDPGENAESALVREVREEVGLEVKDLRYLSSHANVYLYKDVTYHTLDIFFTGRVDEPDRAAALDAVDAVEWHDPLTVPMEDIAFESMRAALRMLRNRSAR